MNKFSYLNQIRRITDAVQDPEYKELLDIGLEDKMRQIRRLLDTNTRSCQNMETIISITKSILRRTHCDYLAWDLMDLIKDAGSYMHETDYDVFRALNH